MPKKKLFHTLLISTSLVLGLIFLFSGIIKLFSINSFIGQLHTEYKLGILSLLAPVVVFLEIYIGIQLLFLQKIRQHAFIFLLLIIGFTLFYTYGLVYHKISECHCFGSISFMDSEPIYFYIRNLILSLLAFYLYQSSIKSKQLKISHIILPLIILFTFILGLKTDIKKTSGIVNQFWYGASKPKSLESDSDSAIKKFINPNKTDELQMVFFMSESCEFCLNSIENLKSYKEKQIVDHITIVIVSNHQSTFYRLSKYFDINKDNFDIRQISKKEYTNISRIYPTTLFIQHNKIILKHLGLLPSIPVLTKEYPNLLNDK